MKKINTNPLYVVKGKNVEEATNFFDLVLKKFNLEPVIQFLQTVIKMLLEQVKSYSTFVAIKTIIDELMTKYLGLIKNFGLA